MVKVRMNTADVAAEVKCLRRLIGMRCSNVYDLTPKTYLLKLMHSSGVTESGESEKVFLLMESGVRLHTTAYVRDKSNTPSGFTLKLRKHIRTRRLEHVKQLGYDRIILFQFGLPPNAFYLILELYAQGNIILTDSHFTVMTLLRSHRDDDKGVAIMSRHPYPTDICRTFERTTRAKLELALTTTTTTSKEPPDNVDSKEKQGNNKRGKNSNVGKQATLKIILGEALGYGPALSEHMILDAGLPPNIKVSKDNNLDDATIQVLAKAVDKFEDWLSDVISGETVPQGYILMQNQSLSKDGPLSELGQMYDEFCPILLNQFKAREHIKFDTFDAALDEFYSKIESQRSSQQQKTKEASAIQKLNKIRTDQENRVLTLKQEVDRSVKMAELIEYNLEDVDAAILAVRVALAKGMNWEDLARMVKEEQKSGNPVAGVIDKLHLERNCMTLLLSNNLDEMDDDEKTLPVAKVEVDLALSAHANARRWYEQKKKQESKQEKTVTAHEKAFKAAERKTRLQLAQEKTVATISHMRKVHWFEKFNWFISSENYLVISGRDAQQNEMIVKRYMSKGDLYIHADLHGASTTVIKNHRAEHPVPPLTLNQAGCFTVCHSQAWDSKMVTSAWWVYPRQVSKTAPTGEYLTVGSFMIRGKKNFLPPHPLVMGFGLLFRLDESSLGLHLNERRVRGEEEEENKAADEAGPQIEESDTESDAEESKSGSNPSLDLPRLESEAISVVDSSLNVVTEAQNPDEPSVKDSNTSSEPNVGSVTPQLEDLLDRALGIGSTTTSTSTSTKKYSLDTCATDMVDEEHDEAEKKVAEAVRDRPHISKAERRKLKKGQKNNVEANAVHQEDEPVSRKATLLDKMVEDGKPGSGKSSRGQKGKLKKMKDKYGDQDDEERSIRMALLASAGKALKKEDESPNTNSAAALALAKEKIPIAATGAPKICYKCKKQGHLSRDCPLQSHENGVGDDPDTEIDKVGMEEDDIHEIGQEEKEKLNEVDYLTGNPLSNDIVLYAVPVCGPYSALQSYKYRAKIIPGTAKKGKAAKSAMNLFSHMNEATNREKELMKACTDPELVAAIIGNVKITAAGLTHLKQKQKKTSKKTNNPKP